MALTKCAVRGRVLILGGLMSISFGSGLPSGAPVTCAAQVVPAQLDDAELEPLEVASEGDANESDAAPIAQVSADEASDSRIDGWIAQLGDTSYIQRQNAKHQLEKLGLLAFERLRRAAVDPNIEIATNAQYLLQSMRVVWTLPTDSFSVQRLVKDYNEFQPSQKIDRMQRLAKLDRADADLALLRFVRYESSENLSKLAALYLMDAALEAKKSEAILPWADVVRRSTEGNERAAVAWLRALLESREDQTLDLTPWSKFAIDEVKLLESNSDKTSEQTVKRLYRWTAKWLAHQGQHREAVEFIEPSLELLGNDPSSTLGDVVWMLDEGLFEAVLRLSEQKPNLFSRAQLRYLLAESHLKHGSAAEAERVASEARDLVRALIQLARPDGKFDHEASQRMTLAQFLNQRGLYDWAEAELLRAESLNEIAGQLSSDMELGVREELAQFYWIADQPLRAADVWRPILVRVGLPISAADEIQRTGSEEASQSADRELRAVLTDRTADSGQSFLESVPSNYHYYLGLAAIKSGNLAQARQELTAAIAFATRRPGVPLPINPDIVIAMSKAGGDDLEFRQRTEQIVTRSEDYYRERLLAHESELASATTRQQRHDAQRGIASECNQLAWLLAGTGQKPSEAIRLSQRSLLLIDDSPIYMPVYLDTLARCYFSSGDIEKAIELQSQAIEQMPFERQMRRQLAEFRTHQTAKETSEKR